MKKQLDELLKCALTPMDEPSFWLNQKILNQVKEQNEMIGKEKRRFSVATIVLAFILCLVLLQRMVHGNIYHQQM